MTVDLDEPLQTMLQRQPHFSGLPPEALEEVLAAGLARTLPANHILFLEGDYETTLFVVLSGQVKLFPVAFESGQGCVLKDVDGNEYIDFSSGIYVTTLGHCHPKISEAIAREASKLMNAHDFTTEIKTRLMEKLATVLPGDLKGYQLYDSGTTAVEAGIRVQTIKRAGRGAVTFGTEVFSTGDRSLAALLGASPGASVAVNIALETIKTCLPHLLSTTEGRSRMKRMIPTYDEDLKQPASAGLFDRVSRESAETLGLTLPLVRVLSTI